MIDNVDTKREKLQKQLEGISEKERQLKSKLRALDAKEKEAKKITIVIVEINCFMVIKFECF